MINSHAAGRIVHSCFYTYVCKKALKIRNFCFENRQIISLCIGRLGTSISLASDYRIKYILLYISHHHVMKEITEQRFGSYKCFLTLNILKNIHAL